MYPYELNDAVFIKENFGDFFLNRAMKELKLEFFVTYNDYGFEHDTETDELYIYIDGDYDSLIIGSNERLFELCDTSCFEKTEDYGEVYENFVKDLKDFLTKAY